MKRVFFTCLLLGFCLRAFCQTDYFLLPENFYPQKGETLDLHLLNGSSINKAQEQKYDAKSNIKFYIHEGSKPIDVTATAKAGAVPVLTYKMDNTGLLLVSASVSSTDEISKREFTNYLSDNALDKVAEDLKQFQRIFKIRTWNFMKTLLAVEKNGGNVEEKPLKQDFEIILQQNPYKMSYGDDITAVVYYQGKPLKAGKVNLIIRTATGNEFPQMLTTNENGEIFFKTSREGTYMLKAINIVPSKDQEASDYDVWQTTFTFAFSSSNTMPNTYKEFGFGNVH